MTCFCVHIKMGQYLFNRQELLQKAKDRYHNRAEYYTENKDVLRENAKNEFRSLFEEKKEQKENMEEIDVET